MSKTITFACDPGASGALAVLHGADLLAVEDMPTMKVRVGRNDRTQINEVLFNDQVCRLFKRFVGPLDEIIFVIEHVSAMPKDGSVQAFAFGLAFGLVRGVMAGHNVRKVMVRPAAWKKALKLNRGKDASRQLAIETWPVFSASFARVKDDGRAEAALIGLWHHRHGDR